MNSRPRKWEKVCFFVFGAMSKRFRGNIAHTCAPNEKVCFFVFGREKKKKKKKKQKKKTDDEDPLVLIFSPKVAMVAA